MPTSTFRHEAAVAAGPAAVWEAFQDPGTWSGLGLMDTVADAVVTAGRLQSFSWTARAAGSVHRGTATTTESLPAERMRIRLDSREIDGEIEISVSAAPGGSRLGVSLTARSRGLLAGMFWGAIAGALERGLAAQVDGFAARF